MNMSEKPELVTGAIVGLGSTLGRVVGDAATRLGTLAGLLDPRLPLMTLADEVEVVQDNQDIRQRASERNAGETRLALRRIIDLLALRPLDIRLPKITVSVAPAASAPANDWQRLETATKSLFELNSVGDVLRSSVGTTLAFRGRLMQVREAAGQPYDPTAEAALSDRMVQAGHDAAMPRDKVLELAQAMVERKIPLSDVAAVLPVAAKFAQGQGVSTEIAAQLVSELQQKGGINNAADLARALSAVAWRGQKEAPSVELFSRGLLTGLTTIRTGDAQKVESLLQSRQALAAAPADLLQQGVEKRRESPLGQLEQKEQLISGAMLQIGDALLKSNDFLLTAAAVMGGGLLAVKSAIGIKQFAQDARGLLPGNWGKRDVQDVFVTNWPAGSFGDLPDRSPKGKGKGKSGGKTRPEGTGKSSRGSILQRARSTLGRAASAASGWMGRTAQPVRSSRVGRVAGGMLRRGASLARAVDASGVGQAVGSLARGAGTALRRFGPVNAALAITDAASIYNSNQSPQEKAVGYGKAGGSAIGAAAGAALGTLIPIPVVGTLVGGAIGASVGEWIGGKAGALLGPSDNAPKPPPAAPQPAAPAAATPVASGPPNWTFSPQVSINVAGNIVNPQQLLDELIPTLRRLIGEAQQERQRNALFDTVVV
ncbi:glycine zipper domain-containing protein [Pseudomonas sp.]|uniref:glycine zipper domain-containing protein n=1 Tax=unclassified Pseudomonas TaxID=196821 RepID=UPI0031D6437D